MRTKKEKYFIITIDTEGDNIWHRVTTRSGMRDINVKNAEYIERFQKLCERFHFIPTYLVDYEMANAEVFISQAKEWLAEKKCEIGMHMHAWNTPPIYELPFNAKGHNPFAGEYPRYILWKKIRFMTEYLEDTFGTRPVSHRGGRWYVDPWYIQALMRLGYISDCSITSGVSWSGTIGNKEYGPDYSHFSPDVFCFERKFINASMENSMEIRRIVEIPPTIISPSLKTKAYEALKRPGLIKTINKEKIWLRPTGSNLEEMLYIVKRTRKREYIEFVLHSSELMPGGSPTFKTRQSIEKLYQDLEILFSEIAIERTGISLSDYTKLLKNKKVDN